MIWPTFITTALDTSGRTSCFPHQAVFTGDQFLPQSDQNLSHDQLLLPLKHSAIIYVAAKGCKEKKKSFSGSSGASASCSGGSADWRSNSLTSSFSAFSRMCMFSITLCFRDRTVCATSLYSCADRTWSSGLRHPRGWQTGWLDVHFYVDLISWPIWTMAMYTNNWHHLIQILQLSGNKFGENKNTDLYFWAS